MFNYATLESRVSEAGLEQSSRIFKIPSAIIGHGGRQPGITLQAQSLTEKSGQLWQVSTFGQYPMNGIEENIATNQMVQRWQSFALQKVSPAIRRFLEH